MVYKLFSQDHHIALLVRLRRCTAVLVPPLRLFDSSGHWASVTPQLSLSVLCNKQVAMNRFLDLNY